MTIKNTLGRRVPHGEEQTLRMILECETETNRNYMLYIIHVRHRLGRYTGYGWEGNKITQIRKALNHERILLL